MEKQRIKFVKDKSPDSFSNRIQEEVRKYFEGKNKKGTSTLYIKTIVILLLLASSYWYALASGSLLVFGIVGALIALVGFNIMHDAAHGSYSDKGWLNDVLSFIGADVMGGSSKFWHEKHNIMHHTYTNIVGADDDIGKSPLFRLAPSHEWKWFHRYQHIYCWFLYTLLTISWFYHHDFVTYKTQKLDQHSFKMSKKEKGIFWLGKCINIGLFVVLPITLLGWEGFFGILIMHAVASVFLSLVFQMAHVVEGVSFYPSNPTQLDDWFVHEIKTTANFAAGNPVWTLLLGGLNYQVEHHLFRDISHIHYPAVSKIVQNVCKEMNIQYNSFPTFRSAIASHYRHLKYLGSHK